MGLFGFLFIVSVVLLVVGIAKRNQGLWITALTASIIFGLIEAIWAVTYFML